MKALYILFIIISLTVASESKVITVATVNNKIITNIDINNEIKIINILYRYNSSSNNLYKLGLNNLINEIIKNTELNKLNIKEDENFVKNQTLKVLNSISEKNLNLEESIINTISEKIKLENRWNKLISQKYLWKISINMDEINNIYKEYSKKEQKNKKILTKDEIIQNEKNKKLKVYSDNYLENLKKSSFIKIY